MCYFALLVTPQRELTPEQRQAEMQAYSDFHARERAAIRGGDALARSPRGCGSAVAQTRRW
jgi:alkylhydroperoxidase family enzyme